MVQLRNGRGYSLEMTHEGEHAIMAELYPDPEPQIQGVSVQYLMQTTQDVSERMFPNEEERLLRLHHILEMCTLEHEREVQKYQAAHRDLVKDEGEFVRMLAVPDVPACAFNKWEKHVNRNMHKDRKKMKASRERTTALLRAIEYAEGRIKNAEKVVGAEGKADRLLEDSGQIVARHMARMAVNANVADEISGDPRVQALVGEHGPQEEIDPSEIMSD